MAQNWAIHNFGRQLINYANFKHNYDETRKKYIFAFSLVIVFSIIAQVIIQYSIHSQKENSKAINISGRQRMLSQRISKLVVLNDLNRETEVSLLVSEFLKSHKKLIDAKISAQVLLSDNSEIKEDFYQLENLLTKTVEQVDCWKKKCSSISDIVQKINVYTDDFLYRMDKIVYKIEQNSQEELLFLSKLETIIFIILSLVLFLEFFYILLPFQKSMIMHLDRELNELKEKKRLVHMAGLGELGSSVIHEIKNFLTVISFSANSLRRHLLEQNYDESMKNADRIITIVNRINNLTSGMMKVSRISDSENILVTDLLKSIDEMFEETFKSKSIEFVSDIGNDFHFFSNKTQILQILYNLIKNSIHAVTGMNDKKIILSVFRQNGNIVLQVSDTGVGILPEHREKVTEAFFTTKGEGVGTGLGLSLSKKIAEELGGELRLVESSYSTTFQLTIVNNQH